MTVNQQVTCMCHNMLFTLWFCYSSHRLKSCSFYTSLTKCIIPNTIGFNLSVPGAFRQICVSLLGAAYYKTVNHNQVGNALHFPVLRTATWIICKCPLHLPIDSLLFPWHLTLVFTNLVYWRISSCLWWLPFLSWAILIASHTFEQMSLFS